MVTELSIIGRLVGVLRGLGVPALFGSVAGCHSGPLVCLCVLSKLYPVAAVGVLLWGGGSFVVLVCEEGVWLLWCNWDVFNREKKTTIKSVMS